MTNEQRRALDGYEPGEMAIPEWRLIQKTGGDYAKELGAKPGQFYNSMTDEIADELNLVIVDIPSGRARWGSEITGDPLSVPAWMPSRTGAFMETIVPSASTGLKRPGQWTPQSDVKCAA